MKAYLNGKLVEAAAAHISAFDNGFLYGDGIYETMRTYEGKILELDLHLERLAKSAKFFGIRLPFALKMIRRQCLQLATVNRLGESRMRITLSRGANGFDFLTCRKPTLLISCEKLTIARNNYAKGVSAITMRLSRVLPEIKTLGLTHMMVAYRAAAEQKSKKIYEVILVDEKGFVREGASTNIFAVKKGAILTPARNILKGLTRDRVIQLVRKLGLKISIVDFSTKVLANADEIFLTNRPREIIPVVRLNGKKVGKGKPGPVTKKLMAAYQAYIKRSLFYSS